MNFSTENIITVLPTKQEYIEKYGKTMCAGLAFKQAKKVYIRTTLAEAQNWKCCFCGIVMVEYPNQKNSATIEHVIPSSKGGTNSPKNYAISCNHCNNKRGTLDWEVFMEMGNKIVQKQKNKRQRDMEKRLEKWLKKAHKHAAMDWKVNVIVNCFDDWINTLKLGKYKDQFMQMLEADGVKTA